LRTSPRCARPRVAGAAGRARSMPTRPTTTAAAAATCPAAGSRCASPAAGWSPRPGWGATAGRRSAPSPGCLAAGACGCAMTAARSGSLRSRCWPAPGFATTAGSAQATPPRSLVAHRHPQFRNVLLVRGTFLRIAGLRFRSAYISVAVRRSTMLRRGVPIWEPGRRPGPRGLPDDRHQHAASPSAVSVALRMPQTTPTTRQNGPLTSRSTSVLQPVRHERGE
jgi:hypothetical protein